MPQNKITFRKDWDGRWEYYFIGSLRQPTLVEARNYIVEKRLQDDVDDYFGIAHISLKCENWAPPEENKTLVLYGYDGGSGDGTCPVCGHERDMGSEVCPVCLRPWDQ